MVDFVRVLPDFSNNSNLKLPQELEPNVSLALRQAYLGACALVDQLSFDVMLLRTTPTFPR